MKITSLIFITLITLLNSIQHPQTFKSYSNKYIDNIHHLHNQFIQSNYLFSFTPNTLLNQVYQGQYHSLSQQKLFEYLDVQTGISKIYFIEDKDLGSNGLNEVEFIMYNPIYHDQKAVVLVIPLPDYNQTLNGWINETSVVSVYYFDKQKQKTSFDCNASIQIYLKYQLQNPSSKNTNVTVKIFNNLNIQNRCIFNFQTQQMVYYQKQLKVLFYCLFISALIAIQMICDYKMFRQIAAGRIDLSKISLATATFCNIQDLYLILTFVVHLMNQNYYMFYVFPITLFVLLTVGFDMRLVILIWKNRNMSNISATQLRRKLVAFYILFYLGVILYSTLMFLFPFEIIMILIQGFYFIPQIIHNYSLGINPNFYFFYIFGFLSFRRYLIPLYQRGCPNNLFMIHPSKTFVILWTLLFLLQISFLFIQYLKGPRFFIPKKWIKGYYEYRFKIKFDQNTLDIECPICLELLCKDPKVHHQSDVSKDGLNQSISETFLKQRIVMKAPCKHMFHQDCFMVWIDVKLECPVCRMKLPAYIE